MIVDSCKAISGIEKAGKTQDQDRSMN